MLLPFFLFSRVFRMTILQLHVLARSSQTVRLHLSVSATSSSTCVPVPRGARCIRCLDERGRVSSDWVLQRGESADVLRVFHLREGATVTVTCFTECFLYKGDLYVSVPTDGCETVVTWDVSFAGQRHVANAAGASLYKLCPDARSGSASPLPIICGLFALIVVVTSLIGVLSYVCSRYFYYRISLSQRQILSSLSYPGILEVVFTCSIGFS